MEALLPILLMVTAGVALSFVYIKCRKLSQRARRIARIVSTIALFVAAVGIFTAVALPGPANKYQYNDITKFTRTAIGLTAALPLLFIPLWVTILLGSADFRVPTKTRWSAVYLAFAGAALSPIGLFALIFSSCTLAGACL